MNSRSIILYTIVKCTTAPSASVFPHQNGMSNTTDFHRNTCQINAIISNICHCLSRKADCDQITKATKLPPPGMNSLSDK